MQRRTEGIVGLGVDFYPFRVESAHRPLGSRVACGRRVLSIPVLAMLFFRKAIYRRKNLGASPYVVDRGDFRLAMKIVRKLNL